MNQDSGNEIQNSAIPTSELQKSNELDAAPKHQNPLPCGCGILGTPQVNWDGTRMEYIDQFIKLCPLHAAAPALYEALKATPCLKADFEGDTCQWWADNYDQELCQRCAALALATVSAPANKRDSPDTEP